MQIIRAFFVIFLDIFAFFRQNAPFSHMRNTIYLCLFMFDFCLFMFDFCLFMFDFCLFMFDFCLFMFVFVL